MRSLTSSASSSKNKVQPFHLFDSFRVAVQPPFRPPHVDVFAKDGTIPMHGPSITANLCPCREELTAYCHTSFRNEARENLTQGWMYPHRLLDAGLKKRHVIALSPRDMGAEIRSGFHATFEDVMNLRKQSVEAALLVDQQSVNGIPQDDGRRVGPGADIRRRIVNHLGPRHDIRVLLFGRLKSREEVRRLPLLGMLILHMFIDMANRELDNGIGFSELAVKPIAEAKMFVDPRQLAHLRLSDISTSFSRAGINDRGTLRGPLTVPK